MSQKNKVEVTFDPADGVLKIVEIIPPAEGKGDTHENVIPHSVIQSMFDHGFEITVAGRQDGPNYVSEFKLFIRRK